MNSKNFLEKLERATDPDERADALRRYLTRHKRHPDYPSMGIFAGYGEAKRDSK